MIFTIIWDASYVKIDYRFLKHGYFPTRIGNDLIYIKIQFVKT